MVDFPGDSDGAVVGALPSPSGFGKRGTRPELGRFVGRRVQDSVATLGVERETEPLLAALEPLLVAHAFHPFREMNRLVVLLYEFEQFWVG